MNMATDNDIVKELIANAINASNANMWLLVPLFKIALDLAFYSWLSFPKSSIYFILLSISFYALYYTYKGYIRSARKQTYRRRDTGRPPAPFSVSICDAIIERHTMVLSAICINTLSCFPSIQTLQKSYRFTQQNRHLITTHQRLHNPSSWIRRILLLSWLVTHQSMVHALPGTNHVLISGEQSLDSNR